MITAIAAVDREWAIGYNGELLAHISEDMKRFKQLTKDKVVVMGRKTWESLPIKPLPSRTNIVVTHCGTPEEHEVLFCSKEYLMQQAWMLLQKLNEEDEWFIIGGGQIYKQFLPLCDRAYITKIFKNYKPVDTFFPNLDLDPEWKITDSSELKQDENGIYYQFVTYERV